MIGYANKYIFDVNKIISIEDVNAYLLSKDSLVLDSTNTTNTGSFSFKIKNANIYLDSFMQAQRQQARKVMGYDSKIKSELYNIIYNLQTEYHTPYTNSKIIDPAINYIHSNYYKENISIEHLATLCGISTVFTFLSLPGLHFFLNFRHESVKGRDFGLVGSPVTDGNIAFGRCNGLKTLNIPKSAIACKTLLMS